MKNKILHLTACSLILTTSYLSGMKRGASQLKIPTERTSQQQETISSTTSDFGLFDAVVSGDIEKVREILTQHQDNLDEQAINKAFIKAMTGRVKNLKPKIALLFLEGKNVKEKLSGLALDKAIIKSLRLSFKSLFSKIIDDEILRKKLYTGNDKTKKLFEKALKDASIKKKSYIEKLLSYQNLRKKLQHLDYIKDLIPTPVQDHGLFDAVASRDIKKVRKILTKHQGNLDKKSINQAFIKAMTGNHKKDLKPKIALLFLKNPKVKEKLSGQALDKAITKSIRRLFKDLFSKIIEDETLRKKLYTSDESKESFESALKFASNHYKYYFKKLLSFQDLRKKLEHLDYIKDLIPTPIQDYGLFDSVVSKEAKKVREILTKHQDNLNEKAINRSFIKAMTGKVKKLKPKIALLFLKPKKIKDKLSGQALDKAIIKSIRHRFKKIFFKIIEDKILRKKLYTSDETKSDFKTVLEHATKYNKYYLKKILIYPDFNEKVQHLDFLSEIIIKIQPIVQIGVSTQHSIKQKTQPLQITSETPKKEPILSKPVCKKQTLKEKSLNPILETKSHDSSQEATDDYSVLPPPPFAQMNLTLPLTVQQQNLPIKKRIFISKQKKSCSPLLQPAAPKKLPQSAPKKPVELIEQSRILLVTPISKAALNHDLLNAVASSNVKKVQELLTQHHNSFDTKIINQAFIKAVRGPEKNSKPKVALLFLEIPEIKEIISGQSLDKALTQSIWHQLKDLFFKIIKDETLRKKLYTDDKTKKSFEKGIKHASKHNKPYLEKLLSYPDLKEKIKHLTCLSGVIPNKQQVVSTGISPQQPQSSVKPKGLFLRITSKVNKKQPTLRKPISFQQPIRNGFKENLTPQITPLDMQPQITGQQQELPTVNPSLPQPQVINQSRAPQQQRRRLGSQLFIPEPPVEHEKSTRKAPRKSKRRIIKKVQREKVQDFGLFDAVVSGEIKKVEELLTQHQDDLDQEAISRAFIKSMTGAKKINLKPKITLLFLETPEVKKKLSAQALDKAVIKSILYRLKDIFLKIIEDEDLRKKLYTSDDKTKKSFEKALKRASREMKSYLNKIKSYPDLKVRIQNIDLTPNKTLQDPRLSDAITSKDIETILKIMAPACEDHDKSINQAFIKSMTGSTKKDLKPKVALLFLETLEVKEKLSGYALDKAFIRSINHSLKNLFLKIIEDEALRKKLYTDDDKTKESFENALKSASKGHKSYLKKIRSYPDLKIRIQHLDLTPTKTLQDPRLSDAIKSKDIEKILKIMAPDCKDHNKAINKAFIKAMSGQDKEIKPEVALLFLERPEVKEKLSGYALDKAFIKSIRCLLKVLFFKIIEDETLRQKLYTSDETKESFEKVLKRASTRKKSYFKKILSYPDLKEKIKHLECIPKKILETASQQPQETVPSQPDNTTFSPVYNTQFSPFNEGSDTTQTFLTIPNYYPSDANGLYTPILEEEFQPSFDESNLFPLKSLEPQEINSRQTNNIETTQSKENMRKQYHKHSYSSLDNIKPHNYFIRTPFSPLFDVEEASEYHFPKDEYLDLENEDLDLEFDESTPLPLQDTQHEQEYELTLEDKIGFFLSSVKKLDVENLELFLALENENNSLPIISGAPLVKALEILKQHLADNDKTTKQKVCLILDELKKYEILTKKIRNYCKNKSASDPNRRLFGLVHERSRKQNASNKNKCELFS